MSITRLYLAELNDSQETLVYLLVVLGALGFIAVTRVVVGAWMRARRERDVLAYGQEDDYQTKIKPQFSRLVEPIAPDRE
jgi:hypothetical protein